MNRLPPNTLNLQPVVSLRPLFRFSCACCGRPHTSNPDTRAVLSAKPSTFVCARCGFYLERDDPVFVDQFQHRQAKELTA